MISCIMDTIKERKIIICDIRGAFLQADWLDDIDYYLKFERAMVNIIYDIDLEYKKNILDG